jgi:phytoene/squalene synthetase
MPTMEDRQWTMDKTFPAIVHRLLSIVRFPLTRRSRLGIFYSLKRTFATMLESPDKIAS